MLRTPSDGHFGGLDPHVVSSAIADGSTDAITIPDSNLLYDGDFKRAGNDLILSDDKHKFVVQDYFLHDKHPTLLSPKGGALTPDVVLALAGSLAPGQYAQATAPQPQEQPIGRVVTVSGNVVAIRNGVSITLNAGDAVLKNDVLQTGSDGKIAVTFNDGATFDLGADARIVLTEFVYDPNGTTNNSVVSLIRGQLSFIAGEVAHTGDMKVVTPVATMGIRGTVGIVSFGDSLTLTVADQADGQVHSIAISDSSGNVIGHATSVGGTWVVTSTGVQEVARQTNVQQDLSVVQTLLNLQTTGMQIVSDLNNTKTTEQHHTTIEYQENNQQGNNTGNIKITTTTTDTGTGTGTTDTSSTKIVTETYIQNTTNTQSNLPPLFVGGTAMTRVAVPAGGLPGAIDAVAPDSSADGRFVAFFSASHVPGQGNDNNLGGDVYLYDRQTNTTTAITHASGNGVTYSGVSISQDGRYVVYQSRSISGQSATSMFTTG